MTGSLRVYKAAPARRSHDHVDLEFANGSLLRYHDPRRFGAILWSPGRPCIRCSQRLGPEPLGTDFDPAHLFRATRKRTTAIKLALMDNRVVVGVGNIYANESLFRAGIRPTRVASRVSGPRLRTAASKPFAKRLPRRSPRAAARCATMSGSDGAAGYFQLKYFVYGREGAALPRLRNADPRGSARWSCDKLLSAVPALVQTLAGVAVCRSPVARFMLESPAQRARNQGATHAAQARLALRNVSWIGARKVGAWRPPARRWRPREAQS